MALRWLTPSSACVLTSSGSVDGSESKYVWLGLAAASVAACAAFYRSGSATADMQLWTLTVGACRCVSAPTALDAGACGVYVELGGTGASAIVAIE